MYDEYPRRKFERRFRNFTEIHSERKRERERTCSRNPLSSGPKFMQMNWRPTRGLAHACANTDAQHRRGININPAKLEARRDAKFAGSRPRQNAHASTRGPIFARGFQPAAVSPGNSRRVVKWDTRVVFSTHRGDSLTPLEPELE